MKIAAYKITYLEVPDEVNLTLWISECPRKCENCQTPWLQESTGEELTVDYLSSLVQTVGEFATNIVFLGMGDDSEKATKEFIKLATWVREETDKKVTLYTGSNVLDWRVVDLLDYWKTGPYVESLGPLSSPTTNQVMWQFDRETKEVKNVTYKFQGE